MLVAFPRLGDIELQAKRGNPRTVYVGQSTPRPLTPDGTGDTTPLVALTDRLDDLQVYKLLHAQVETLESLANRCHSPAAATACRATAIQVRTLASALYRSSISATIDKA